MASLLSKEEAAAYHADVIERATFGVQPSTTGKPKALILAGQPGSGKGALSDKTRDNALATGGVVVADPDRFREQHKYYKKLARQDDKTAADKTHEDASEASQAVRKAAMAKGLDLIIDGTLKSPEKAEQLVKDLVAAGYEVEVVALCVPLETSWAGVEERYQKQKRVSGYGRSVPRHIHDDAANGMVKSLEALRKQGLVTSIQVVDRESNILQECSPRAEAANPPPPGAANSPSISSTFEDNRKAPHQKPKIATSSPITAGGGGGRPAARTGDMTTHGTPLTPGPGSLNVLIGSKPAWRALPAAAGAALQSAQAVSDTAIKVTEAATVAAAGTPGAPVAYAAEQAAKTAAAIAMASMMTGLAAGAAAASGGMGMPDMHLCPIPTPLPPHGPGYVIDGSMTVLVNGLPLSRMADTVIEALGGPDKIVMGEMQVLVGG